MSNLPEQYKWLEKEPGPKMLIEALKLYGIREIVGKRHNPEILSWAKECGIKEYKEDETPWCGLFMAVVAKRAGKPFPDTPLWARSWAKWGTSSPRAALGDVLVFTREGGGHVALYVGENKDDYYILGGNQQNSVCIVRRSKLSCIAVRRLYSIAAPSNVRPIQLSTFGPISTNEA